MEEKERYYYKEYAGDYDILDRNDKNAYYGAISRDEEDAQNLINLLNQQDIELSKLRASYQQVKEENKQLKQQLAEKDKEISNLNGLVRERDKQIKNLKTNKKRVIEHKNKTKISFTIEQLEKVKENAWQSATDISCLLDYTELAKIIDSQIKELKGEE